MYTTRNTKRSKRINTLLLVIALLAGISIAAAIFTTQKSKNTPDQQDKATSPAMRSPFGDANLYVHQNTHAARQARLWRTTRPTDAATMDRLAAQPSSQWIGTPNDFTKLAAYLRGARATNSLAVTVSYNIPKRDCGLYSSGGAPSALAYRSFIDQYARIIGSTRTIVILEPDALVHLRHSISGSEQCLNTQEQQVRFELLRYAVQRFKALPATYVYIDAGNSGWVDDVDGLSGDLQRAGINQADGFSLNVSNFRATQETITYGTRIARQVGNKHFVVDTSRNGNGPFVNAQAPAYNWCNPPGRALGSTPTTQTKKPLVDAYLYIKNVGESDGTDPNPNHCFGGPPAGTWWPEYALGLVQRQQR